MKAMAAVMVLSVAMHAGTSSSAPLAPNDSHEIGPKICRRSLSKSQLVLLDVGFIIKHKEVIKKTEEYR